MLIFVPATLYHLKQKKTTDRKVPLAAIDKNANVKASSQITAPLEDVLDN